MNRSNDTDRYSYILLALLGLVWGCSFILIKKALITFSPQQVACLRVSISFLAFLPFMLPKLKKIEWKRWYIYLFVGLTGNVLPAFLFAFAQQHVSSSMAGILNSTTPIWTLVLGIVLFHLPMERNKVLGIVIGFIGAIILVISSHSSHITGTIPAAMMILLATLSYGTSANLVQKYLNTQSPVLITGTTFLLVGPFALAYLFGFTNFVSTFDEETFSVSILSSIILAVLGTVLANIYYYKLVQWTSAVFASTVTYIIPLVALSWGAIDGEQIHPIFLVSLLFIIVGVYLAKNKIVKSS